MKCVLDRLAIWADCRNFGDEILLFFVQLAKISEPLNY